MKILIIPKDDIKSEIGLKIINSYCQPCDWPEWGEPDRSRLGWDGADACPPRIGPACCPIGCPIGWGAGASDGCEEAEADATSDCLYSVPDARLLKDDCAWVGEDDEEEEEEEGCKLTP